MSRRVSLPHADDLFRPTVVPDPEEAPHDGPASHRGRQAPPRSADAGPEEGDRDRSARTPSGRVRHDEKMTVYVTSDELLDLEHARLMLRRSHGLAVDRGRLVRAAIAMALADFDENGEQSVIVQRLNEA